MGQITTSDVARHASVSRVTVSRVLNNRGNVTEEVRQLVLKAAHDLGYLEAKGRLQEAVFDQSSLLQPAKMLGDVGFFFSSLLPNSSATDNPFWSPILRGVEREAHRSNANVIYRSLSARAPSPAALKSTIRHMKLGGILLVGSAETEVVHAFHQTGTPLVLVDLLVPEIACDSVIVDNIEGLRLAVQHLLDHEHTQIAYIGGPVAFTRASVPQATSKIFSLGRRLAGYFLSLLEADLPLDFDLVQTGELSFEGGYNGASTLLASKRPFTAIVCANDETAIGAMKAVQETGRRVPEDISIIGFDDIESARHVTPELTTIRVDKGSLGTLAMRALAARALDPETATATTMLSVRLVERHSVAKRG
jgi:LacI family transcriptional regulator